MDIALESFLPVIDSSWTSASILIVGDIMLDKYIHGRVTRISPEAPVPIVHATRSHQQPGGAANVAMNIAKLGGRAILAGFTGDDQEHTALARMLLESDIQPLMVAVPNTSTTTKLRVLGGQQQIVRLDFEDVSERTAAAYDELLERIDAVLPTVTAVILSDYAKGALIPRVCRHVISAAQALNIPVLVDPKVTDYSRYAGATTVCPNLSELAAVAQKSVDDLDGLFETARRLISDFGFDYVTVTMSEKGIAIVTEEKHDRFPATAREVSDVSGAGDTAIATLALCASAGIPVAAAAKIANLAAGIVVEKVGTVAATHEELNLAISNAARDQFSHKILALPQLRVLASQWRKSGETIVFTNGCFDLLHAGHIKLLQECKAFGERLIIAINSDLSVSRLKGPTRPIIPQRERAQLLAALSLSDAVVVFDEETPLDLIVALQPHVLVKGGDYSADTVVGASEIKAWGGHVEIIPLVANFSTSNIVSKVLESHNNQRLAS